MVQVNRGSLVGIGQNESAAGIAPGGPLSWPPVTGAGFGIVSAFVPGHRPPVNDHIPISLVDVFEFDARLDRGAGRLRCRGGRLRGGDPVEQLFRPEPGHAGVMIRRPWSFGPTG